MKSKVLLTSLFAGAVLFTGCFTSTYGNPQLSKATEKSVQQKIVKGKTTKAQIKQMFGSPTNVNFLPNGEQEWKYTYSKGKVKASSMIPVVGWFTGGTKSSMKELTIIFDKKGIVKDYMFTTSNGESHTF